MGGHYTAFIKVQNKKWYEFDDKNVNPYDGKLISKDSYCLFYRKKKLI